MKKATLVSSLVLSGIILAAFGGSSASASTVVNSMDTETKIEFSGHIPNPDPDGNLDLIWVPAMFDFGVHDTSTNTSTSSYSITDSSQVLPKYVIVQDNRTTNGVTATDWEVTATASELRSGPYTLNGATINYGDVTSKRYNSNDITVAPETPGVIVNAPTSDVLNTATNNENPTDGTTPFRFMWTASTNAVPSDKYAGEMNDDVTLTVPAGIAQEGSYSGTVTWTLTSGI